MRSLVKYERPCIVLYFFKMNFSVFLIRCQKSLKRKTSGRHSGRDKRAGKRRRPRQRHNLDTLVNAEPYQILARVRDCRHTRVGNKRKIFARFKSFNQHRPLLRLIMLIIACHRHVNIKMIKKFKRIPRILRRNKVNRFKGFQRPYRHIPQIAYRGRAEIKFSVGIQIKNSLAS